MVSEEEHLGWKLKVVRALLYVKTALTKKDKSMCKRNRQFTNVTDNSDLVKPSYEGGILFSGLRMTRTVSMNTENSGLHESTSTC